jgi:hypothetical protein
MSTIQKVKPANATWVAKAKVSADDPTIDFPLEGSTGHAFAEVDLSWYEEGRLKITIPRATPGVIRQAYLTGKERDLIIEVAPRPERSTKMPESVTEAAEGWLTRFIYRYEEIDGGPSDRVHAVLEKAREFLEAGPTEDDPFTISEQIVAALPGESDAATLGDRWRKELERLK